MLTRLIGSAAGLDAARGDTIEVAMVAATALDSSALITDPTAPIATAAAETSQTSTLGTAAAAGAGVMLLLGLAMRRRRKKKEKRLALLAGTPLKGRKARKAAKYAVPMSTTVLPAMPGTPVSTDPDRVAVDEIKGDLERMMAESPESLAALLSSWMAK
jgi:flagellar M-ring protein FliF